MQTHAEKELSTTHAAINDKHEISKTSTEEGEQTRKRAGKRIDMFTNDRQTSPGLMHTGNKRMQPPKKIIIRNKNTNTKTTRTTNNK